MKKIIGLLLAFTMLIIPATLSGCGKNQTATVRVATLMGPTGMGMAKLMDDSNKGTAKGSYKFTVASAPEQVMPGIISGEVDVAAVPVNLAATLYQKTNGAVQIAAVNTLGVLYLLENGNTVQSIADLKGKTVYATGKGSTPEYILNYILQKNGINPEKDVQIEYLTEHTELATKMTGEKVVLGVLPEPNVSAVLLNNQKVRIALNLTEEWNRVCPEQLVQGSIVVRKDFAEQNAGAFKQFLKEYKNSVDYVNGNVKQAAQLIESAGILPKAAIAEKALPNSNICYISGKEMKTAVQNMLQVMYGFNAKSVGGKLPDENFYR